MLLMSSRLMAALQAKHQIVGAVRSIEQQHALVAAAITVASAVEYLVRFSGSLTGAASGIGRSLARRLSGLGSPVAIADIDEARFTVTCAASSVSCSRAVVGVIVNYKLINKLAVTAMNAYRMRLLAPVI